jgi:putative colanic acid biosynthesis acetyltransferase WcaF
MPDHDPYLAPAFPLTNRIRRFAWGIVYALFFRPSPRPMHGWRRFLLRAFGAEIGEHCHIYPTARIWAPWNLRCGDVVAIADGATVYNPSMIEIGSHATISQEVYLCGATHDYQVLEFPLISAEIHIGAHAWVCARATVQPGLRIGEGAVLALGSVATRDLDPWSVYAGIPARKIKDRVVEGRHHASTRQNG